MTRSLPRRWTAASCSLRFAIWLFPALALAIAASWMTVNRHQGYQYRCLPMTDLYQLADEPWISRFSMGESGRLRVEIENLAETRWIQHGVSDTELPLDGGHPVVQLSPGIAEVVLSGKDTGESLSFRTQWIPEQPEPLVSPGSIRIGGPSGYFMRDFVTPLDAYAAKDVGEARRIMAPLQIDALDSDIERAETLARDLHAKLTPFRGQPSARMRSLNGLEQYREALAGRSGVYCANHAEIFSFMANAAGLPTRLVDVSGALGDVAVGAHSFVEVYLAEEQRWVYMGLQLSLAGVLDAAGNRLSAAQVLARIRNRSTSSLVVRTIRDGQIFEEDWAVRSSSFETFLSTAASLVFLPASADRFAVSERLKRLFFDPPPAICENGRPDRTAVRLIATWAAVGWGILCLWIPLRHFQGRCGCAARA